MISPTDSEILARAVDLASANVADDGGPFGAVVATADGRLVDGANRVTATHDPTAHAEVTAIRAACAQLHYGRASTGWYSRLGGTTLPEQGSTMPRSTPTSSGPDSRPCCARSRCETRTPSRPSMRGAPTRAAPPTDAGR